MGLNAAGDTYEDGDFSQPDADNGYPVTSYPFFSKGDAATRVVTQNLMVKGEDYRVGVPGSRYPFSGLIYDPRSFYLIEESEPSNDHGYFRFTRTWSQVPRTREEGESFVYTNIFAYETGISGVYALSSQTKNVNSLLSFSYVYTSTPSKIPLKYAYRVSLGHKSGDNIFDPAIPVSTGEKKGNLILAEDSIIRRWRGNIWEIQERYVDLRAFNSTIEVIQFSSV